MTFLWIGLVFLVVPLSPMAFLSVAVAWMGRDR